MSADRSDDPSQVFRSTTRAASRALPVFCFSILAETETGVMPRVLEVFAKRDLVPRRWVSDVGGSGDRELSIDLQVEGLTRETADYIARCLRGLHYVDRVLTSEKASI